jgi:hypothetical protein
VRGCYFEALFIRNFYNGFITCPSLLEAVGIRFPVINIRGFNTLYTSFLHNKCLSARWVSASDEMPNNVNVFDNNFLNINLLVNLVSTWSPYFVTLSVTIVQSCACLVSTVQWNVLHLRMSYIFGLFSFTFYMFNCANSVVGSCTCWVST